MDSWQVKRKEKMKTEINNVRRKLINNELLKRNGSPYSDKTISLYNLILPILSSWMVDFEAEDYNCYSKDIRICRNFMNDIAVNLRAKMRENNLETVSEDSYISVLKWCIGKIDEIYAIKLDTKGNAWRSRQVETQMMIPEHDRIVEMIKNFVPKSDLQSKVFRYMVTAALTSARYSDIKSWTFQENIQNGYLVYRPQKTDGKRISIPLNPLLESQFNKKGFLLCRVRYSTLLRTVKEIFRLNGFDKKMVRVRKIGQMKVVKEYFEYEKAGLHRLRASAITAMLSNGLSETEVKSFSGHSLDSKSFKRYVDFSQKHLDSKFNGFAGVFE